MGTHNEESSTQVLLHTLEKYQNFISEISKGVWRMETVLPVPCDISVDEQIGAYFKSGYLAEANLAMARMYGFDKVDDLKDMPLKDLLIPEDPRNREYLKAFIQSGYRLKDAESVEKDRHGEIRYFLNNLVENLSELVPQNSSVSASYNQLKGKRVLLVEDSEDNQVLIARFLGAAGMHVEVAGNGREGIDKAQSGQYDLIVMDIQMPGVDGHEAARTLRRFGYDKPIIALTAHALKEDKERAYANGFSEYLTKPIDPSVLIQTLEERLSVAELH